ncbi:MAG TPA: hypothetical protein VGF73_07710 [Chthoniobacterales bacterium]
MAVKTRSLGGRRPADGVILQAAERVENKEAEQSHADGDNVTFERDREPDRSGREE